MDYEFDEMVMITEQDYVVANTWRLIIERTSKSSAMIQRHKPDFSRIAEILPEYRLMGLHFGAISQGVTSCH